MTNEAENDSTPTDSEGANTFQKFVQRISAAFYGLIKVRFILSLLAIALVEAALAAIWPKFAVVSVATAVVSIGLTLANCSLLISEIGMRAGQIYQQLILLHDEEIAKLAAQRRGAPTPAQPRRPN